MHTVVKRLGERTMMTFLIGQKSEKPKLLQHTTILRKPVFMKENNNYKTNKYVQKEYFYFLH